jgi:hypothetical protein
MGLRLFIFFGLHIIPLWIFAQGSPLDKGVYCVDLESAIGCRGQLQSFNPKINDEDLFQLISILRLDSRGRGLNREFSSDTFIDVQRTNSRGYYKVVADSLHRMFENSCIRLQAIEIPDEFNEHRCAILNNYCNRLSFDEIVTKWISDDNFSKFKNAITGLYNDAMTLQILDTIETTKGFHDQLYLIQFKLYNYFNRVYFPTSGLFEDEKLTLEKNNLRIVYETCPD